MYKWIYIEKKKIWSHLMIVVGQEHGTWNSFPYMLNIALKGRAMKHKQGLHPFSPKSSTIENSFAAILIPDLISRRFLCLHFQKTDQSAQDGLRLRPYMATHTSFGHVTSFSPFYHSRCFELIKILKYEHNMSLWLSGITKSQLPKANWLFQIRS